MQPTYIKPQLASLSNKTPNTNDWLHEVKYDGYRIIAIIKSKKVTLYTRNHHNWTDKLPGIVKLLTQLPDCILDGELVTLHNGISNFEMLQNEISNVNSKNLIYKIFDIMYCRNHSLMDKPLIDRKKILKTIFKNIKSKIISPTEYIIGQGEEVFRKSCELGLEGIISKRLDSPYQQRRTKTWIKSKCTLEQKYVIVGYTPSKGSRKYFGALILAEYKNKQLVYCGHVGTGFTEKVLADIFVKMQKIIQPQSPLAPIPNDLRHKKITWLKPKLTATIKFVEKTNKGLLRAPSFLGLIEKSKLTHAKMVIKALGCVTKEQVANYYEQIYPYILPHIKNRPLSLLRCPALGKKCFFQKNILSKDLSSLKKMRYICANNKSNLYRLSQAGVIELHPWGSKIDKIEKPDRITFDLDPGSDVAWSQVITGALYVRKVLKGLGLESFVKTSGGKGLHIVVPIIRKHTWSDIKLFAQAVAGHIAQKDPELFTAKMSKSARSGKIFIDYLRNVRGATTVAAYSLRARDNAPISTPISWRELKTLKSSTQFNIFNINKRLAKLKSDPWPGFFQTRQSV